MAAYQCSKCGHRGKDVTTQIMPGQGTVMMSSAAMVCAECWAKVPQSERDWAVEQYNAGLLCVIGPHVTCTPVYGDLVRGVAKAVFASQFHQIDDGSDDDGNDPDTSCPKCGRCGECALYSGGVPTNDGWIALEFGLCETDALEAIEYVLSYGVYDLVNVDDVEQGFARLQVDGSVQWATVEE